MTVVLPRFWVGCLASCAVLLACPAALFAEGQEKRPNFILFIGDDHSTFDTGCYGNQVVRTRNIDRLATEGMRFDAAFTSTAMCAPSRSMLYTGLYPHRNGCHMNHGATKEGVKSVVHYLSPLGYKVVLAGKTHIKPKSVYPFEYMPLDFAKIDQVLQGKQPFCLIIASDEPHGPHKRGGYKPEEVPLPPYLVDTPSTRAGRAGYYTDIDLLDAEVGKVLELLDRSGKAADTLFIYVGDHGDGILAKWSCYEIGLRVPCIARWPGRITPGTATKAMVSFVDVLPTFMEAAGTTPPADINGRSFLPVLRARKNHHRTEIFGAHTNRGIWSGRAYPIRSVRNERYKYIRNLNADSVFQCIATHGRDFTENTKGFWPEWKQKAASDRFAAQRVKWLQHRPAEELYDLQNDPWEMTNRADDPKLQDIKKDLRSKLDMWMKQQNDAGMESEMKVPLHK